MRSPSLPSRAQGADTGTFPSLSITNNPLTGAGVVISTGSAVTTVSPGDKVLLSFSHCETCKECTSGHPAYCHTFNDHNFGGARPDASRAMLSSEGGAKVHSSFFGQSSFANHTLVHRSSVVRVAPETELALFAPLGCGMQTGTGAVLNTLDVKEGSTVAVFGVGSAGMAAVMAAGLIRKAKMVIAVDLQQSRLELAKDLGATHGVLGRIRMCLSRLGQCVRRTAWITRWTARVCRRW